MSPLSTKPLTFGGLEMSNIKVEVGELVERGWSLERIATAMNIPFSWVEAIYSDLPAAFRSEDEELDEVIIAAHTAERDLIARLRWS